MRQVIIILSVLICPPIMWGQECLSLEECVEVLALDSPAAKIEKKNHANELLEFDNYKKSLLPSFSLDVDPVGFNHSMKLIQNAADGSYNNIDDYTLSTGAGVSVSQKIGFTGGTLSASSTLNYLNEFNISRNSFSTTPFSISYSQPLWGGGKSFRFTKDIEYKKHSLSLREYCTSMADVQKKTAELYLQALSSQIMLSFAQSEASTSDSLLLIAKARYENGDIVETDYRQAQIRKSNNEFALVEAGRAFSRAASALCDYLGLEVGNLPQLNEPVFEIPSSVSYVTVRSIAETNGVFYPSQDLALAEAGQSLYNARKNSILGGNISVNYGTNQYANAITNAYRKPNVREYASISFSIPIFQWGIESNRRRIAENEFAKVQMSLDQGEREFLSSLIALVDDYNTKAGQYELAKQTYRLSLEQGEVFLSRYKSGMATLSDWYSLLQEQTSAARNYLSSMIGLWNSYYDIRKQTLHDFISGMDLVELYTKSGQTL